MDDDWKREVKADLAEVRKDIKVLLEDVGRLKGVSALISGIVATVVAGAITAVLAFALSGCAPYPPANGNLCPRRDRSMAARDNADRNHCRPRGVHPPPLRWAAVVRAGVHSDSIPLRSPQPQPGAGPTDNET